MHIHRVYEYVECRSSCVNDTLGMHSCVVIMLHDHFLACIYVAVTLQAYCRIY